MSLSRTVSAIFVSCAVFASMIAGYHYFIMLPTFSKYEKTFYVVDFEQLSAVKAMESIVKQSRGELTISGAADVAKMAEEFRTDFMKALGKEVGKAPVFAKNTVVTSENVEDITLAVAGRLGLVIDEAKLKDILFYTSAKRRGLADIQFPEKIIDENIMNVFNIGPEGEIIFNDDYLMREFGTTDLSTLPQKERSGVSFEKFE